MLHAQLQVNNSFTAFGLADKYLKGYGISVSNAKFTGDTLAKGYFYAPNTDLGITEGIILSTGNVYNAVGPNGYVDRSTQFFKNSIPELDSIAGINTSDAAVLEFDFISIGDSMFFSYVFASEEYGELLSQASNDVFGIFISGEDIVGYKNIATIPNTNLPISINNINDASADYKYLYRDNYNGLYVEYDGMTVKLKASMKVKPYKIYHCKIAIADANDNTFDTGVFLEKGSFYSNNLCGNITTEIDFPQVIQDSTLFNVIEDCRDIKIKLKLNRVPDTTIYINFDIQGTATNGVDYKKIDSVITFEKGIDSAIITLSPLYDNIPEASETVILYLPISLCDAYFPFTFRISDFVPFEKDTFTQNVNVCYGNYINLQGKYKGGVEPYSYNWNDTNITGDSTNIQPTVNTTYKLTVKEACGASLADEVAVNVYSNPVANFSFTITRYRVAFNNLSSDDATSYLWDLGSGDTSQQENLTYTYIQPGLFAVKLIAINNYGCQDTMIKIIDLFNSIEEQNQNSNINVQIQQHLINIEDKSNTHLVAEVYNTQAKLVNQILFKQSGLIYTHKLSKGLYLFIIKSSSDNNIIYRQKFIIY
ncbi:MAG: hypothetical protein A2X02_09755 [Bacteroidetes bacterium GWF2_29_10]|nr:MAG: hypothetical protein A2X02_09755 [Bacteroidetes bacterium GWF2_29_10]